MSQFQPISSKSLSVLLTTLRIALVVTFLCSNPVWAEDSPALQVAATPEVDIPELIIARDAISNGQSPDQKGDDEVAPLHYAAQYGNVDFMLWLIGLGADVNILDEDGWSPLMYAVANQNTDAVELLLQNDVNTNAIDNYDGRSAESLAIEIGDYRLALRIKYFAQLHYSRSTRWLHHKERYPDSYYFEFRYPVW